MNVVLVHERTCRGPAAVHKCAARTVAEAVVPQWVSSALGNARTVSSAPKSTDSGAESTPLGATTQPPPAPKPAPAQAPVPPPPPAPKPARKPADSGAESTLSKTEKKLLEVWIDKVGYDTRNKIHGWVANDSYFCGKCGWSEADAAKRGIVHRPSQYEAERKWRREKLKKLGAARSAVRSLY